MVSCNGAIRVGPCLRWSRLLWSFRFGRCLSWSSLVLPLIDLVSVGFGPHCVGHVPRGMFRFVMLLWSRMVLVVCAWSIVCVGYVSVLLRYDCVGHL